MITHPTEVFNEKWLKEVITMLTDTALCYSVIRFIAQTKTQLLDEILLMLAGRIDPTYSISLVEEFGDIIDIKMYLQTVQYLNNKAVNEALNKILVAEGDFRELNKSVAAYTNFDSLALANQLCIHEHTEFKLIAALLYKSKFK